MYMFTKQYQAGTTQYYGVTIQYCDATTKACNAATLCCVVPSWVVTTQCCVATKHDCALTPQCIARKTVLRHQQHSFCEPSRQQHHGQNFTRSSRVWAPGLDPSKTWVAGSQAYSNCCVQYIIPQLFDKLENESSGVAKAIFWQNT